MVLSILGSIITILAVALPEILKWMEHNGTIRKAADVALQHVSLAGLRSIRDRVRGVQDHEGPPPVP
jgi:hypothetical protein